MPFEQPKIEEPSASPIEKRELGKEAELTIAAPLFKELEEIFPKCLHTTKAVDKAMKIDFVLGLSDKTHLAVQFSIAESREVWQKKAKQILKNPLIELGEIHPETGSLSRKERIELVPKILLRIREDLVREANYKFKQSGGKGRQVDFLPNKEEIRDTLLIQALANLSHLSEDESLARRFPGLSGIARSRYQFLNQEVLKFRQKEI